ncbi:hypothetical protein PG985_001804 [Apiospora marii]|uniref:Uncharacterized protein n=1 Tax=Apiospora marii TaxID=335849 RepID=A0ABR1RZK1_9PEZI
MSGQHHYTAANPGQQHDFPQKPSPDTSRLPPSQPTPLLRWLTGVSALLGLVSLVALAFKCLSSISWNDFDAAPTIELMPAGGKDEGDALFLFPLDLDRHSNYGGPLTWAAIVLGLTLAPVTAYCSWRVGKTGPYYYEKPTRLFTYALYHLYWLFPLAVFALLSAAHARSAHMATARITRAATTYGEYAPAGVFDRETLACEASRLARHMGGGAGGTAAAVEQLGRVCVGEEGTRWLLVGIAVVTAGLALILELDRRGGRRFIAVAETGRGHVDARGGFI